MHDVFGLNYKANDLKNSFISFEMNFEGTAYENPLLFLDELAKVRHKIIHVSSILGKGQIYINAQAFYSLHAFYVLLTDYIYIMFSNKFNYKKIKVNPAEI